MTEKLLKTITDPENGRKWEIYENDGDYGYKTYEYYSSIGWRFMGEEWYYSKNCIEIVFDIEIA